MTYRSSIIALLVVLLALPMLAQAPGGTTATPGQSGSAGSTDRGGASKDPAEQETQIGAFTVRGSVEVGYRFVDIDARRAFPSDAGGENMYRTFVNLDEGVRVLEQTLHMRTEPGTGVFFDDLMLTSFGYGGDPEQVIRFRMGKSRWYNLGISARQFQNYWDYNELANPLNPFTDFTNGQKFVRDVTEYSPHRYEDVHRFGDIGLTIAPAAPVSLRLGYSRVRQVGPSWTSLHEGADPLLFQNYNTTNDNWQAGVDVKFLPQTILAFDFFYQRFRHGSGWDLNAARFNNWAWTLDTGTPTDPGLPIDPRGGAAAPCATFPFNSEPGVTPVPASCNQYLGYRRSNPYTTISPTGQVTLQSNFIKNIDVHGRFQYGESRMRGFYDEFARALVSRLGWNQWTVNGPQGNNRTSALADLAVTVHLTENFRWANQFRFYRFDIPSFWAMNENAWIQTATPFNVEVPPGPTPQLVENLQWTGQLGENTKSFQTEVEADLTKFFGAHIGYRFTNRRVNSRGISEVGEILEEGEQPEFIDEEGLDVAPNFDFNEHTAIGGFWFRPSDPIRFSLNYEGTFAEDWMTRVSARQQHQARARFSWTPRDRFNVAVYGNLWEARNGRGDIGFVGRNRHVGGSVGFFPAENFNLDLAYDYTNAHHDNNLCYTTSFTTGASPAPTTPSSFVAPGSVDPCPMQASYVGVVPGVSLNQARYLIRGKNVNRDHFASLTAMFRIIPRVNTSLGYSIVYANGETPLLNVFQPWGSLKSTYHRPLAAVEIEMTRQLSVKGSWNYWGYNERSLSGPTSPRDFHTNAETISLRYSF